MRVWTRVLLAMALLFTGAARAEAPVCVVADGFACLVDASGEALLEGVGDVFCVREGALYAAGSRGAYRLYDARGNALSDATFAMIADAGDCLIYRQGSRYGAMTEAGEVVLPARYTQLTSDGAGGFLVLDTDPLDESPDAILRVDAAGEATSAGTFTSSGLTWLSDGRMPVMAQNGRFGAIDAAGAWTIPARWLSMGAFAEGVAKVAGPGGFGLIDADGNEVVPAAYDWLERGEGIVAALNAGGVDVFTGDGSTRLYHIPGEGLEASVVGGCVLVRDGDAARLYDGAGALLGAFDSDFTCAPGLRGQLVAADGAWGEAAAWLMAPDGGAASPRRQYILPLAGERYAFAEMRGVEYRSAELDRVQTSWDYDSLRFGLMDDSGATLLPAAYREIRALSDTRLMLVSDGAVALSDMDGNAIRTWVSSESSAPTGE